MRASCFTKMEVNSFKASSINGKKYQEYIPIINLTKELNVKKKDTNSYQFGSGQQTPGSV